MRKESERPSLGQRLKSVPRSFVSYEKNSVTAIDEAKKTRSLLAPLIFILIFFISCVFLVGGHLRGVDYHIANTESFLNDYGLLTYVHTFSFSASLTLGFLLFLIFFFIYVLTRFTCVKLFSRGLKASTVLSESVIEFGMNSISLSLFFLFGGILSDLVWWASYPLIFFVFLFFMIMLNRGIFDAVEREKQTSALFFVMAVFDFLALALVTAFVLLVLGYSVVTIAMGINANVRRIIDNVSGLVGNVMDILSKGADKLFGWL